MKKHQRGGRILFSWDEIPPHCRWEELLSHVAVYHPSAAEAHEEVPSVHDLNDQAGLFRRRWPFRYLRSSLVTCLSHMVPTFKCHWSSIGSCQEGNHHHTTPIIYKLGPKWYICIWHCKRPRNQTPWTLSLPHCPSRCGRKVRFLSLTICQKCCADLLGTASLFLTRDLSPNFSPVSLFQERNCLAPSSTNRIASIRKKSEKSKTMPPNWITCKTWSMGRAEDFAVMVKGRFGPEYLGPWSEISNGNFPW